MARCPRDEAILTARAGALGEDVCPQCQGRFLEAAEARRLFSDMMGIPEHILFELAREGTTRIACPACATKMTECFARGVQVDLCRGCGGAWLDSGELTRLAREIIDEVKVAPGLELDDTPKVAQQVRFEVLCVNCDRPLNLRKTNWLINTRPWCPECAAPYNGFTGMLGGATIVSGLIGFILGMLTARSRRSYGHGRWVKNPDVLRIAPEDAEKYFGAFFTRVRPR